MLASPPCSVLGAGCAKPGLSCPTSSWCSQGSWTNVPGVSLPRGAAQMGFGTLGEGNSHPQQRSQTPRAAAVRGARMLSHEQNGCRQRFFPPACLCSFKISSRCCSPHVNHEQRGRTGVGAGANAWAPAWGCSRERARGVRVRRAGSELPLGFILYIFFFYFSAAELNSCVL